MCCRRVYWRFQGPVGGSHWSILLFHLLLMEKCGERELTNRTEQRSLSSSWSVRMYGTAVCFFFFFYFSMIALGSRLFFFFFMLSSSSSCTEENEDQANTGLILFKGSTDSLQLQENFLCGILTVSCRWDTPWCTELC